MTTENPTPGVSDEPARTPSAGRVSALARFLAERSEPAFAELVREHGRMVYGVCLRVLGNSADAEDAFQATFLVLARDADRVRRRSEPVGAWLYGTACRVARFAKRTATRRRAREHRRAKPMAAEHDPTADLAEREAVWVVDDELHRLPAQFQQPVVLCYLGGLTHDQAAEQLGVHPRTLERRLKTGLELLRSRLTVRGVTLSVAAVALLLSMAAAEAAPPPPPLADATAQAGAKCGSGQPPPPELAPLVNAAGGPIPPLAAWAAGIAAVAVVVAGGWVGFADFSHGPEPVAVAEVSPVVAADETPAVVTGTARPAAPDRRERSVTVRGRVTGADGEPLVGVPVALLARPVRLNADKSFDPLDDPLSDVDIPKGRFRALDRGVTDADGKYELTGVHQVPDPTTGAKWHQTLPWVFETRRHRVVREPAEFHNLQAIPVGR